MVGLAEQQAGRSDDVHRIFDDILQSAVEAGDRFGVIGATHMLGNVAFNQCRDAASVRLHTLPVPTVLRAPGRRGPR